MKKLFTLFIALSFVTIGFAQIWTEDFDPTTINSVAVNTIGDGLELRDFGGGFTFIVTNVPAEARWSVGQSNLLWDTNPPETTFSVQSDGETGQNFKINNISKSNPSLAGEVIWESEIIDISATSKFTCSLKFTKEANTGYAGSDFFKVQYIVIDGSTNTINKPSSDLNSGSGPLTETLTSNVFLTGASTQLKIVVTALNSTTNAFYMDDIIVEEYVDPSILIREVQYTTDPGDGTYPSPLVGQTVNLRGVITSIKPDVLGVNQGYYIQDEDGTLSGDSLGSGNWSGIFIYDQTVHTPELVVGDAMLVTGEVVELNGRTEIHLTDVDLGHGTIVESSGNDVPLVNLIVGPLKEKDESVLSTLRYYQSQGSLPYPLLFTAGIGEVNDINDNSSYLITVDKRLYKSAFVPAIDPESLYEQLDGIVNYESGTYRLSPRDVSDFYGLTAVPVSVDASSIDANRISAISNNIVLESENVSQASIYNLAGQMVKQLNVQEGRTEIEMNAGVYVVKMNTGNDMITEKVLVK